MGTKKISSELTVILMFLISFGILGYFYFDNAVYWINYGIWEIKSMLGIEQTRGIIKFKFLPGWANTSFGSIIGWGIKGLLKKIYIKIKEKFFSKRNRRRTIL